MGILAITFRGPFVFEINKDKDKVNAYAPKCDNHHAAIFTANSEWPLCGRYRNGGDYVYEIVWAGITASAGAIEYPPVDSKLIWDPPPGFTFDAASAYKLPAGGGDMILDAPAGTNIYKSEANFCITLPKPKAIYPVNPAPTEVVTSTPQYKPKAWATGLRFYYEGDLNKPINLIKPGKPSLTKPLSVANLPSLPGYADVDVRYAGRRCRTH
jgi:hypothetical protein